MGDINRLKVQFIGCLDSYSSSTKRQVTSELRKRKEEVTKDNLFAEVLKKELEKVGIKNGR